MGWWWSLSMVSGQHRVDADQASRLTVAHDTGPWGAHARPGPPPAPLRNAR